LYCPTAHALLQEEQRRGVVDELAALLVGAQLVGGGLTTQIESDSSRDDVLRLRGVTTRVDGTRR
jgi:hypothetical protein